MIIHLPANVKRKHSCVYKCDSVILKEQNNKLLLEVLVNITSFNHQR